LAQRDVPSGVAPLEMTIRDSSGKQVQVKGIVFGYN